MKNKVFKTLQLFGFDNNDYCNFTSSAAKAIAGKDIALCVFDKDGEDLLAIAGQQGLTINRTADTIEISSKDTAGSWKGYIAGMKEWSIDVDGLYVPNDNAQAVLSKAFENTTPVCVKVINLKEKKGMFGGLASISEFTLEAPYDDAMTYSITLNGMDALADLASDPVSPDTMPNGTAAIEPLTVVSVAGSSAGASSVYVNPAKEGSDKYFYKTGAAPLAYPSYGEVISQTEWNGSSEISGLTAGNQIMIIETDSDGKALKAGVATITVGAD